MQVNQQLSDFSDLSFQSSFVVYTLCLLCSLYYYGKMTNLVLERGEAKVRDNVSAENRAAATPHGETRGTFRVAEKLDTSKVRIAHKASSVVQILLYIGLALHGVSWILRGVSVNRFPLGNLYEYSMALTFMTTMFCAALLRRRSNVFLVPWILTPTLLLMFYAAAKFYARAAPVVPALQSNWIPIHVTTVILGAAIGLLSGVASLLYLLRIWGRKSASPKLVQSIVRPLPSAERLDVLAYRFGIAALPVFGLGIMFGAIWAESAWGRFWGWDPKETVSFMTWILYAAYLHARATPSWGATKAAFVNLLGLAAMLFNLFFINMVVSGLHSYAGLN
ncbi:c-type cytochrome biogenesis protein CcsB [Corynebacterium tuberculostearicum]